MTSTIQGIGIASSFEWYYPNLGYDQHFQEVYVALHGIIQPKGMLLMADIKKEQNTVEI